MRTLRILAIPTAIYLAVTVVAPGLNGGFARAGFWGHAGAVVATCAAVLSLLGLASWARRRGRMVSPRASA